MANVLGTLFQDIADAIRTKTGGTGTMAPADFPGEILSITGGSEEGRTTVWAEQEVAIDPGDGFGGGPATAALVVGNTYTVTWDGVEYECIADVVVTDASNGFGYPFIGNPALAADVGAVGDDNGLPFAILYAPRHITGAEFNGIVVYANDTNNHTVGIYTESIAVEPLLAAQTYEGFGFDSSMGVYMYTVNPSPVELAVGETYIVKWDGAFYTCAAQDMSAVAEGAVGVGNLVPVGGTGNYEGFIVGCMGGALMLVSFDGATSHTVGLFQEAPAGGEWIFAGGNFTPTAATHTVEHNLGVVPDIIFVYVQGSGTPSGAGSTVMSAIAVSERVFGKAAVMNDSDRYYGASTYYHVNNNNIMSLGTTIGLEGFTSSNSMGEIHIIQDVTETSFLLGGNNVRLSTNFGYSWGAFALKS